MSAGRGMPLHSRAALNRTAPVQATPPTLNDVLEDDIDDSKTSKRVRFDDFDAPSAQPTSTNIHSKLVKDVVERWEPITTTPSESASVAGVTLEQPAKISRFAASRKAGFPQVFKVSSTKDAAEGTPEADRLLAARQERLRRQMRPREPEKSAAAEENSRRVMEMSAQERQEAVDEIKSMFDAKTLSLLAEKREKLRLANAKLLAMQEHQPMPELESEDDEGDDAIQASGHPSSPVDLSRITTEEELYAAAQKYLPDSEKAKLAWTGVAEASSNVKTAAYAGVGTFHVHDLFAAAAEQLVSHQDGHGAAPSAHTALSLWLLQLGVNPTDPFSASLLATNPQTAAFAAAMVATDTSGEGKPAISGEILAKDPARFLRFDFSGFIVSTSGEFPAFDKLLASTASPDAGLHHHGADQDAPGYTLFELCGLMRSSVVSQRLLAYRTVTQILLRRRRAFLRTTKQITTIDDLRDVCLRHLGIPPALPVLIRCAVDEISPQQLTPALTMLQAFLCPNTTSLDSDVVWDEFALRQWDIIDACKAEEVMPNLMAAAPFNPRFTSARSLSSSFVAHSPPVSFITSTEYLAQQRQQMQQPFQSNAETIKTAAGVAADTIRTAAGVAADGRDALIAPFRVLTQRMGLTARLLNIVNSLIMPVALQTTPGIEADALHQTLQALLYCCMFDSDSSHQVIACKVQFRGEQVALLPLLAQLFLLSEIATPTTSNRASEFAYLTIQILHWCLIYSRTAASQFCSDSTGLCNIRSSAVRPLTLESLLHLCVNHVDEDSNPMNTRIHWFMLRILRICVTFGVGMEMVSVLWQLKIIQPQLQHEGSPETQRRQTYFACMHVSILTAAVSVCRSEVAGGNGMWQRILMHKPLPQVPDALFDAAERYIRENTVALTEKTESTGHVEHDLLPFAAQLRVMCDAWFNETRSLDSSNTCVLLLTSLLQLALAYVTDNCKSFRDGKPVAIHYDGASSGVESSGLASIVDCYINPLASMETHVHLAELLFNAQAVVSTLTVVQRDVAMPINDAFQFQLISDVLALHNVMQKSPAGAVWQSKWSDMAETLRKSLTGAVKSAMVQYDGATCGAAQDGITAIIASADMQAPSEATDGTELKVAVQDMMLREWSCAWTVSSTLERCFPAGWLSGLTTPNTIPKAVLIDACIALAGFRSAAVDCDISAACLYDLQPGMEIIAYCLLDRCAHQKLLLAHTHARLDSISTNTLCIAAADPRLSSLLLDAAHMVESGVIGYDPSQLSFAAAIPSHGNTNNNATLTEVDCIPRLFKHRDALPLTTSFVVDFCVKPLAQAGVFSGTETSEIAHTTPSIPLTSSVHTTLWCLELLWQYTRDDETQTAKSALVHAWATGYTAFCLLHLGFTNVTEEDSMKTFADSVYHMLSSMKLPNTSWFSAALCAHPWIGLEPLKTLAHKLTSRVVYSTHDDDNVSAAMLALLHLICPNESAAAAQVRALVWETVASSGVLQASIHLSSLSRAHITSIRQWLSMPETQYPVLAALEESAVQARALPDTPLCCWTEAAETLTLYDCLVQTLSASCYSKRADGDAARVVPRSFEAGEMLRRIAGTSLGKKIADAMLLLAS